MALPINDYRVDLDIYNGPLDLLLYLIKRDEIDVYDIPISRITEQFLSYLEVLKALDLDKVGDFIVMAATLMEIKSKMLLPVSEDDEDEEEEEDPRLELVRQLLEYKRFKDAASTLSAWGEVQKRRVPRPGELDAFRQSEPESDLPRPLDRVELWDLVEAFAKLVRQTGLGMVGSIAYDDTPMEEHMRRILDLLEARTVVSFVELFEGAPNRSYMLGCFLALLELVRQNLVRCEQARDFGEIIITIRRPDAWARAEQPRRRFCFASFARRGRVPLGARLRGPMLQPAYQMRACREFDAVPARRRMFSACFVEWPAPPALPRPRYEPALTVKPKHQEQPPSESLLDELREVDAIRVGDIAIDAPEGWTPPPEVKLQLTFRRKPAFGAGRRLFTPQRPRTFSLKLPLRRALSPPAKPPAAPSEAPAPPAVQQSEAPSPVAAVRVPAAPSPSFLKTLSPPVRPPASELRLRRVAAFGKGRKCFRPERPRRPGPLSPPPELPPPSREIRQGGTAPAAPLLVEPEEYAPAPRRAARSEHTPARSMLRRVWAFGRGRRFFAPRYPRRKAPLVLLRELPSLKKTRRAAPVIETARAPERSTRESLLSRLWGVLECILAALRRAVAALIRRIRRGNR